MRVISGTARGRSLRAASQTRPTADLVKGAIFSMLEALAYKRGFEPGEDGKLAAALAWPRVLDLFAGSGALGIEALSRGAAFADFVEQDREATRVIEINLRTANVAERARVHHAAVETAVRRVTGTVDLVFLDPPYTDTAVLERAWSALAAAERLQSTSVVVLEQPASATPPDSIGPLTQASTRRHGRTRITLYAASLPYPACVDGGVRVS